VDDILLELGKIIGLTAAGILLIYVERLRNALINWWKNRGLNPVARAIQTCRAIVDYLVELRVTLSASRCYVMQFHNGQVFTSQDPVYRMSCTQEATDRGLAPVQPELQNILVHQVWQEIAPLFGNNTDLPGVECVHKEDLPANPPYRGTYYYLTQQIPQGWFQSMLVGHGAWAVAISPLIDGKGTLVGFVAAEFNADTFKDGDTKPEELHRVAHAAANIWFEMERHIGG
jgi:hypothetical protein